MKTIKIPLWINGEDVFSQETFVSLNPFDESVNANVSIANDELIHHAVSRASEAQKQWEQVAPRERGKILLNAAKLLREHNDELAEIETCETGRAIRETKNVDVVSAADCLDYMGALIQNYSSRFIPLDYNSFAYTLNKPLGVCAGIGAWNYPLQIAAWKSAPALACGNAFIFKPSELTPITAHRLGIIYQQAGLPDGLFQVIHGDGNVGQKLIEHPLVSKVSLTGSVETGMKVYQSSAKNINKVSLELGGKSPLIIFDDADLDSAVQATLLANFYSSGQICSNGTRVFIHESLYEQFVAKLVAETRKIKMGNPMDEEVHMGPLISQRQKEKVLYYLSVAKKENSEFILEGENLDGNFIGPTIIGNCNDNMTCSREEIFGPVASLFKFNSEDEVIKRANQTSFGLAAGVFTEDVHRAHRVSSALEVGMCWVNTYNINPIEVPFGGAKKSGVGMENGHEVFREYTRTQSIYMNSKSSVHNFF